MMIAAKSDGRTFPAGGKILNRLLFLLLLVLSPGVAPLTAAGAATVPAAKVVYQPLAEPGEKIALADDAYFIYGFTKQPKIGVAIMKVEIFNREGRADTSYTVKGDADMPSMRGAHSTGNKDFSLSAKGAYLLPVRLVMPGDWEIRFTFHKDGKDVLHGAYLFDL